MGTMETVNPKDFIKMNLNDSPVGMAEQTGDQFIYSEKSRDNPKIEMEE